MLHLHHTSLRNNHTNTHHASSFPKGYPIWWWALYSSYPKSPNHESHGRIEAWFADHEDNIQVFLIEMNRKQISIPKVLLAKGWRLWEPIPTTKASKVEVLPWTFRENLSRLDEGVFHQLRVQNDVLLSSIKGVQMEITCSRPRGSQILGFHMWFWCLNSLNNLVLM